MSIKPDRVEQKLDEQLNDGLTTDRPSVPEFFTNNIVGRMIGYLMGWHYQTGKPVKLACNSDGSMRVSVQANVMENSETISGNATDAWSAAQNFAEASAIFDVWAWDNPLLIQRSIDSGVTWQDEIEIPVNGSMSTSALTSTFRVKNKNAGFVSRYQVVGWY